MRTLTVLTAVVAVAFVFTMGCNLFQGEEAETPPPPAAPATPDPAPAAPAAPAATPTPTPAPAAGGGGCAQYAKCCEALSKMQGMEAMAASCATIDQLKASPTGDQSCNAAMEALKAMPTAPGECKQP